jgi:hypothetical protein
MSFDENYCGNGRNCRIAAAREMAEFAAASFKICYDRRGRVARAAQPSRHVVGVSQPFSATAV